jgi:hypothetical protein
MSETHFQEKPTELIIGLGKIYIGEALSQCDEISPNITL